MGGASNCPETPRQKMISMMYLVLTAMLALNVSADILNGFTMVDNSLLKTIVNSDKRNEGLHTKMEYLYEQNPQKVGEWLEKSKALKEESDKMYQKLQDAKIAIIALADGSEADPNGIELQKKDNLDVAGQYAQLSTGGQRGKELQTEIESYRDFIKSMLGDRPKAAAVYDDIFNTDKLYNEKTQAEVTWVQRNFESMPAVAVITMLSKYQVDVRSAETELLQLFLTNTDAGDFRVNKITAKLIPSTKHVIQGGKFQAEIALMAIDTTKAPTYFIGDQKLDSGFLNISCNSIGTFPIKGRLEITDPQGEIQAYEFEDEYTVGAPSATIANIDMNVVYRGYNNRMEISVPGIASEKLSVSATGASLTKSGNTWVCKPAANSGREISIVVSAQVDGRSQVMGTSKFRVKTLPSPTAFLSINGESWQPNKSKVKRADIIGGTMIAEYEDGMLNANFTVSEFTLSVSDGRGGFLSSKSNGNKFSDAQKKQLQNLKPGTKVLIENVKYTGAKSGTLSFPSISLP